ncbi:protoporphyrinogen oxidase [Actinomyces sp. HMSC062G12]|nr:protoporphyrinogen oxidase [Actinomyces sp. HMSC062G12]
MGTKIGILIGFGIGYVLGTRAGRGRYEQIRAGVSKLRRFPVVARPLDAAGQKMSDIVRAGGEQVTDKVADAVKERLFGAPAAPAPQITGAAQATPAHAQVPQPGSTPTQR